MGGGHPGVSLWELFGIEVSALFGIRGLGARLPRQQARDGGDEVAKLGQAELKNVES